MWKSSKRLGRVAGASPPCCDPHLQPCRASSSFAVATSRYNDVAVLELDEAENVMGGFENAADGEYISALLNSKVKVVPHISYPYLLF